MVAIGEKTKQIVQLYRDGVRVEQIALEFGISVGSVEKRIKSFEKLESGYYTPGNPGYKSTYQTPEQWSIDQIKAGFDKFIGLNGRLPTAYEVDDMDYLPSSRQIQRRFGGLSKLRLELGYGDVHFGKGKNRGDRSKATGLRGGNAEDELEKLLVDRFGELFVQSEKRFGEKRNRVDFVVYGKDLIIAIDVFATDDRRMIVKNIAVKIPKYVGFPADVPLFFVVWSDTLSQLDIDKAVSGMSRLSELKNVKVTGVESLFEHLADLEALSPPVGYRPFPRH